MNNEARSNDANINHRIINLCLDTLSNQWRCNVKIDSIQLEQATAYILETNKYIYEQAQELAKQHLESNDNKNFKARIKRYEPESKETLLHFTDEITAWAECEKNYPLMDFIYKFFQIKKGYYE